MARADAFVRLGQKVRQVARDEARHVSEPVSRWKVLGTSPLRLGNDDGDTLEEGEEDFEVGALADAGVGDVVLVGVDTEGDYIGLGVIVAASGATGLAALKARVSALEAPVAAARAYRAGALSIAINAVTAIGLDAEDYDSGGMHDNATNNSRIVAPTPGLYLAMAGASYGQNAASERYTDIFKNGLTVLADTRGNANATSVTDHNVGTPCRLAAGDYIELRMYQSAVNPLPISTGNSSTWLSLTWLGN